MKLLILINLYVLCYFYYYYAPYISIGSWMNGKRFPFSLHSPSLFFVYWILLFINSYLSKRSRDLFNFHESRVPFQPYRWRHAYRLHFNFSLTINCILCVIDFLTYDIASLDFARNDSLGVVILLYCTFKPNDFFLMTYSYKT